LKESWHIFCFYYTKEKGVRIYVITDDLTGANDTAVQFAKWGLRTIVFPYPEEPAFPAGDDADVWVFNTDSRSLTPAQAVQQIRETMQSIPFSKQDCLYKKIDSTLRGNLVEEVVELLAISHLDVAIVAPAYPKNGRTTLQGIHYVQGKPVSETEASFDPRTPVRCSHLPTLFAERCTLENALIHLDRIRGESDTLRDLIREKVKEGVRILIFDAEIERDLETLSYAVLESGYAPLWVGSAGLAEALPEAYGWTPRCRPSYPDPLPKPVLVMLGSMSEVATQQGETFARWAGIEPLTLNPEALLHGSPLSPVTSWKAIRIQTEERLRKGIHSLLLTHRKKVGSIENGSKDTILKILAGFEEFGATFDFSLCAGIIVTGGDIAAAVCKGMEVTSIEVLSETSPGIPLGRIRRGRWEGLPIVTKAGAFGAPDALILATQRLSTIPGKEVTS